MKQYQQIPVNDILKNRDLKPVYYFVEEKHAGQLREGTERIPHLNHLLRVFEISMNALVDAPLKQYLCSKMPQWIIKIASVALLHDVIEDTQCNTKEKLAHSISGFVGGTENTKNISEMVYELSNPPGIKEEDKRAWQVPHARTISVDAKVVKISDMIANVIDVVEHPPLWTFQEKWEFVDKTIEITDSCVNYLPPDLSPKYKPVFGYLNELSANVCEYAYGQLKSRDKQRFFLQEISRGR
ncbi:MAG: hypothetical protein KBT14_02255 [Proteobacteria bacterium]|nr:hypothetical protein [Candidatus Enterousia onthequi]